MAQSDIQSKTKAYLQKHQIEEILGDLVTTLSHHQIKNPIIYMIKYLGTIHCTQKELQEAGIQIELKEKLEQPILCLSYKNIETIPGLLKSFKKESFYSCKNRITDQGNNFRSICRLIWDKENQKAKPSLYAVDPSSYLTYHEIFDNFIKEKSYLNGPTKELSYTLTTTILDDVKPYLEESIFVLRRNVPKQRFGSTLQNRAALTKELCSVLNKQQIINYSLQYDLNQLASEDVRRLQINDKLFKKKDPSQSNINQIFKDLRHPDWPLDRMVLQSNDKQNIVWINREDHLKFKFLNTEKTSIIDAIDTCCKMNQFLDSQNLVSFDDKFGYHTVKPQFSGIGITFSLKFKLDSQSINKIKSNSNTLNSKIQYRVINIQTKEKDKHFIIKTERCTGLNMKQYIEQLCNMLTILFEGVIKKPETINIEKNFCQEQIKENQQQLLSPIKSQSDQHTKSPIKSPSHVAIDILQTQPEELDYYTYHKTRLDKQKKSDLSSIATLDKLVELFQEDTIYYPEQFKKFLLMRRNLSIRKINLEELIKLNAQELNDQQKKKILKECHLQETNECRIFNFKLNNLEYSIILNLEDDLIFIFPITLISLSQQIHKIQKIVDSFITNEYKYAWDQQIGYLTQNNEYLGSGISIISTFPQDSNIDIQGYVNQEGHNQIVSVINNSLVLNSLNQFNIQIYKMVLSQLFVKIKQKQCKKKKVINNEICESDCCKNNQLWAPNYNCFEEFEELYSKYIHERAIECFYQNKQVPKKNYSKIDPNSYQPIFSSNGSIKEIKCTFFRNFEKVKYLHEMSFLEKKNFKTKYYKLRQHEGLKFGKNHHLELTFECVLQDFVTKFISNWNLLEEIDEEFKFQRQGNFGFLGPILNQSLLEGFQLEITFNKPINLEKMSGYQSLQQNEEQQQNDDQNFRIISNRPCLFEFEVHLMKQIM